MNKQPTVAKNERFYRAVIVVVGANFLAQIPYFLHQYYFPRHILPGFTALSLMLLVLTWFLVGYFKARKGERSGYFLLFAFLSVEFLFYFLTQVTQFMSGRGILLYVLHPHDVLLFIVFGIGYINLIGAGFFILYMIRNKGSLLSLR